MRSSAVWTPEKWFFCHYMARFDPIFPLKSGLGSKFPWDGSANPWDGNENPWDVSAETPHTAAFPTLKGGRTCASALTLCHIAHKHCRPFCRPAPRRAATTQSGPRRWDGGRFVWAGCGAAGRYPSRRAESFSSMSRVFHISFWLFCGYPREKRMIFDTLTYITPLPNCCIRNLSLYLRRSNGYCEGV